MSGNSAYLARALGVLRGSLDVVRFSMRGYKTTLKTDGLWQQWPSRRRLAAELGAFVRHVAPYLLCALLPDHRPRQEPDELWVVEWLAGYDTVADDAVPLVDTHYPETPVPFSASVNHADLGVAARTA